MNKQSEIGGNLPGHTGCLRFSWTRVVSRRIRRFYNLYYTFLPKPHWSIFVAQCFLFIFLRRTRCECFFRKNLRHPVQVVFVSRNVYHNTAHDRAVVFQLSKLGTFNVHKNTVPHYTSAYMQKWVCTCIATGTGPLINDRDAQEFI